MEKVVPIIRLATDLAQVQRTLGYRAGHLENDAEHSYQLALSAWSVNKQYKLDLRDELILKYALVHDLVEVYAGDTDAMGDQKDINEKESKEARAFERLKKEFSAFDEMLSYIEQYETKKGVEAQLVYIVDKFIPDVNVYYGGDTYYKDRKITVEGWKDWFYNKINYEAIDEIIKPFIDESVREIETTYKSNFYEQTNS